MNPKRILLIICLLCLMVCSHTVMAEDAEFQEILGKLRLEGVIPSTPGRFITYSDYTDELALMGYSSWFPLIEAENFVLHSKLTWESASDHPDSRHAGCGIVFGSDPALNYYVMASVRMDGTVYVDGQNRQGLLNYGNTLFSYPVISGSSDLVVVVNGTMVRVYLDNELITEKLNVASYGNSVGPAILSGTNYGYGTRCIWENTTLYIF